MPAMESMASVAQQNHRPQSSGRLALPLCPVHAPRGERQFFANSLCGFAGLGSSGVVEARGGNEDLR